MAERFIDGLKRASSAITEFLNADLKDKPEIFVTFLNSIKVSAGSAHQLAHAQENPNWFVVRDKLEFIMEKGPELPLNNTPFTIWLTIKNNLEGLIENSRKMLTAKAMPRYEVLSQLAQRQKAISIDG